MVGNILAVGSPPQNFPMGFNQVPQPKKSFWNSGFWQVLKIGVPVGLGFLCAPLGLGFLATSTLTSGVMGGMSYLEKKGTKGTLSSEDQVDIAVDFAGGFLGGAIGRLKIFQGANTYKSVFTKSAFGGAVSGGVVGGGGRLTKDLINKGEINFGHVFEETLLGIGGGALLGGAFGTLGYRMQLRAQRKATNPSEESNPQTQPVTAAKAEVPTLKSVPKRLLNHSTDEKTYRALEKYIERRFGKMPDNPKDFAIWYKQVKHHLRVINRRCQLSEEELFKNADFGVPMSELEVFRRVTRSVSNYNQYIRQNNPIEIPPPATLPQGAPTSFDAVKGSTRLWDKMIAVDRYQADRLNWAQSHNHYDGPRTPGQPKAVPWSTDKVCYEIAPMHVPMGTRGIQTCVSIIIKDPANKRHYLAHIFAENKVKDIKASLAGFDLTQCGIYIKEGTSKSKAVLKAVKALQQLGVGDRVRFVQCHSPGQPSMSVISWGNNIYSSSGHDQLLIAWQHPHLNMSTY